MIDPSNITEHGHLWLRMPNGTAYPATTSPASGWSGEPQAAVTARADNGHKIGAVIVSVEHIRSALETSRVISY